METTNSEMVKRLLETGCADERVAEAMLQVDRRDFVPAAEDEFAYADAPLPIGHGQTISAPSVVALMLKELEIEEGMKVLEIGTGSGYQTAILSKLVGGQGKVVSIEILKALAEEARARIAQHADKNVELVVGSGSNGYEAGAPYDRMVYSAAAKRMPVKALKQLKDGGRAVVPVGSFCQYLYLVERREDEFSETNILPVAFVELKE